MDEEQMVWVARQAAFLLEEYGGYAILDEELRRKGFTLAAYNPDQQHNLHTVMGEVRSDCRSCMEALYPDVRELEARVEA